MKVNKLNLGCGKDIREGFVNVDCFKFEGVDRVCNLNKYPYPFEDNFFDFIFAKDILEHLDNPEQCIKELWRISKPKGKIQIHVPNYTGVDAWGDLTHKRPFSRHSFIHFDIECKKNTSLLSSSKEKFKIDVELEIPKLYSYSGIGFFIKRFPVIHERFFGYLFPIQSLVFTLFPVK